MKVRLKRAAFVGRTYRQAGEVVEVSIAKSHLPDWMEPVSKAGRKPGPKGGGQEETGGEDTTAPTE